MGRIRFARAFVPAALWLGVAQAQESAGSGADAPRVPIRFAPNAGQCDPAVRFQARVPGLVVSVLVDGLHLSLDGAEDGGAGLRLRFVGADPEARVEGLDPKTARASFFSSARVLRDLPTFAGVRLTGLYPGVDLELHESAGRLEYDLLLAPGADERRLELEILGSEACRVDARGVLLASVGGAELAQLAPVAWQEEPEGGRRALPCAWRRLANGHFGYDLSARDPRAAAVIDPVLVYGAHVGGSNADEASAVFLGELGSTYVTGWARSVDFPVSGQTIGPSRGKEAVVFRLAPDGHELLWATSLGGRGDDRGMALQVTPEGHVIVAGVTQSDDFPTTENAFDRSASGGVDGFVLGLDGDGSTLLFATLLGGSAEDEIAGLALDDSGRITLAGTTRSRDFPTSSGSYCGEPRGGRDAFVARLDSSGERLLFATRLGGSDDDEARALAVDSEGCTYLTGRTLSHDFPTTLGALDRERCGVDAFVCKLSGGGRSLVYSTFLGGSGQDEGMGIAIDGGRRAYVVGWTQSLDFPFDADQRAPGRKDGFAVRLSATGNGVELALPLGGSSADEAMGVTIDAMGDAWVVGRTRSSDFPLTRDAWQGKLRGAIDGFLVRISSEKGAVTYGTLAGLEGEDELCGVHADRSGTGIALCGFSANIPVESRGPLAGKRRGPTDAYVLRFDPRSSAPATPSERVRAGLGF